MRNKWLQILLLSLLIVGCQSPRPQTAQVEIGGVVLTAEIARSTEQQARGLSGRDGLAENQAMLFPYNDYQTRVFWMKEMRFPIDIIWIRDEEVVGVEYSVPAPTTTDLTRYPSPQPVNYVLEVPAGWAVERNLQIGSSVKLDY